MGRNTSRKEFLDEMLKKANLITDEETEALVKLAKNGNVGARNRLVKANLRFIYLLARGFSYGDKDLEEDLISEGSMGIIRALELYDPSENVKFLSYASTWIKNYMQNYTKDNTLIRLPADIGYYLRKARKGYALTGIVPTLDQLTDSMDIPRSKAEIVIGLLSRKEVSLDSPIGSEEGDSVLGDTIKDESSIEGILKTEIVNDLTSLLKVRKDALDPRSLKVIEMLFIEDNGLSLEDVGKDIGISKERVRQIRNKAFRTIRRHMAQNGSFDRGLGDYL